MRWFTITGTTTSNTTEMQRDYVKEYSPSLGRDMELLHFGHAGRRLLVFPPGLTDEEDLAPLTAQHPKVIVTGEEDPNVGDSVKVARLLQDKGVDVDLEIWSGWAHDWPYWTDMMRRYLA